MRAILHIINAYDINNTLLRVNYTLWDRQGATEISMKNVWFAVGLSGIANLIRQIFLTYATCCQMNGLVVYNIVFVMARVNNSATSVPVAN